MSNVCLQIYIQNEYCEGGSLQRKIEENRRRGERFSEGELRRVLGHVAKGLQYIHSKQLVHLNIDHPRLSSMTVPGLRCL